ncbi:MAG: hypothetical protein ABI844_01710 [Saprospiraceae bacterium]
MACSKDHSSFKSSGEIIGLDYRKCACWGDKCGCCGNWVIKIEESSYLFKNLPISPKLDLSDPLQKFPIPIFLDWKKDPDSCAANWGYIIIDRFALK